MRKTWASLTHYSIYFTVPLEQFSFECRKVIGFAFTTLRDWFKKFAPLFHPTRSKTKTNRDSLARVFPQFASSTCNYFTFWLVPLIICALCDWLEWLLWFWFYNTRLKTALSTSSNTKLNNGLRATKTIQGHRLHNYTASESLETWKRPPHTNDASSVHNFKHRSCIKV